MEEEIVNFLTNFIEDVDFNHKKVLDKPIYTNIKKLINIYWEQDEEINVLNRKNIKLKKQVDNYFNLLLLLYNEFLKNDIKIKDKFLSKIVKEEIEEEYINNDI